jgi:hypothetical protein
MANMKIQTENKEILLVEDFGDDVLTVLKMPSTYVVLLNDHPVTPDKIKTQEVAEYHFWKWIKDELDKENKFKKQLFNTVDSTDKGFVRYWKNIDKLSAEDQQEFKEIIDRGEFGLVCCKYNTDTKENIKRKTVYVFDDDGKPIYLLKKSKVSAGLWRSHYNPDRLDPNKDRIMFYTTLLGNYIRLGGLLVNEDIDPVEQVNKIKTIEVLQDAIKEYEHSLNLTPEENTDRRKRYRDKLAPWEYKTLENPTSTKAKRIHNINTRRATKTIKAYLSGLEQNKIAVVTGAKLTRLKDVNGRYEKLPIKWPFQIRVNGTVKNYLANLPRGDNDNPDHLQFRFYSLSDIADDFLVHKYPYIVSSRFRDYALSNHKEELNNYVKDNPKTSIEKLVSFHIVNDKDEQFMGKILVKFLHKYDLLECEPI